MAKQPTNTFGRARPVGGSPENPVTAPTTVPAHSGAPADRAVAVAVEGVLDRMEGAPRPTPEQYAAKGRVLHAARNDSLVQPATMSAAALARLAREPRVEEWCRSLPWFKDWLASPSVHEEQVEALLQRFVDGLQFRCPTMADKDFIAATKLLAELSDRMPKKWVKERVLDQSIAGKSEDELKKMVLDAAKSMGYALVPIGAGQDEGGGE